MALITRTELAEISQRRSQQDLLELLPRVHELLDELGAPSLEEEVAAAAEAAAETDEPKKPVRHSSRSTK